eukprot:5269228-Prymnesium_polylepis.1
MVALGAVAAPLVACVGAAFAGGPRAVPLTQIERRCRAITAAFDATEGGARPALAYEGVGAGAVVVSGADGARGRAIQRVLPELAPLAGICGC